MNKPAPNQKLQSVLSGLRERFDLIRSKIDRAEAEGRITPAKAEELRRMLR